MHFINTQHIQLSTYKDLTSFIVFIVLAEYEQDQGSGCEYIYIFLRLILSYLFAYVTLFTGGELSHESGLTSGPAGGGDRYAAQPQAFR